MSTLTYPEAIVMGLIQGVSELFPVSSLGHAIVIPAIVGGQWAQDLNVSAPESPYLAFIVGLHVATAFALLLFFRKDWIRIFGGLFSSLRRRRVETPAERMAWLLILATIPVGIAGLTLEHTFRTVLGRPLPAAAFLALNGLILLVGEVIRRRRTAVAKPAVVTATGGVAAGGVASVGVTPVGGTPAADQRQSAEVSVVDDLAIAKMSFARGILIGATEIFALLPGISRSGVVMVGGMAANLTHREAARFSFLLATPVILAAGLLKLPDLFGPLGQGIGGQVLAGSAASFIGALFAVAFLDRYFTTRTLLPFAFYCLTAGIGAFIFLSVR